MKLMQKACILLLSVSVLLTGCISTNPWGYSYTEEDATSDTEIGEEVIDMSSVPVQVTEEDYRQFQEIREELKNVILNKSDAGKLSQMIDRLPRDAMTPKDSEPWPDGYCYLSSVPLIQWDCPNNNIYNINLLAFSEDKSELYSMIISFADGKIDYESVGYEEGTIPDELIEHPKQKYVLLRADFYTDFMIDQKNRVSLGKDYVTIPKGFCDQFDFEQMGVSFEEATAPDVCIKVDMDN